MSNYLDNLDRTFLDLSSKMTEPFCKAWDILSFRLFAPVNPGRFGQCETRTKEIAARTLIGAGILTGATAAGFYAPLATFGAITAWGVVSKALRGIGFAVQKNDYTHVQGKAPEKSLDVNDPKARLMCWNVCGVGGGMAKDHGGVNNWQDRLEAIAEKICVEDPDLLVLEEIYDTAFAEALVDKLKNRYAHFFIHCGPNFMGSVSGLMVLSKCAVHDFSYTAFSTNDWTLNRGFASIEIKATPQEEKPFLRIVGTHLNYKPEDGQIRAKQIAEIANQVALKTMPAKPEPTTTCPTIVMGDLNFKDASEAEALSSQLRYGYLGEEPTISNRLKEKWYLAPIDERDEIIDQIAVLKEPCAVNVEISDCRLSKSFDETFDTNTALSDHHAIVGTVSVAAAKAEKPAAELARSK